MKFGKHMGHEKLMIIGKRTVMGDPRELERTMMVERIGSGEGT